ncbi:hypothetical protein LP419_22340 [Massilia sp. H-1]|nr:hypothetical protein LP419_22340 [Massilia sp. H-1]
MAGKWSCHSRCLSQPRAGQELDWFVECLSAEPGTTKWLDWKYITTASGSVSFDTTNLAPGNYAAWMLFDDGYQRLGGPCAFTVQ